MSQSPSNQIVALTANTVANVGVPQYYDRIITTNETTADVCVATNGSAVATTAGAFGGVVLLGAWRMMGNDQPREPNNTPTSSPQQEGWTVQNRGYQGSTSPNLNPLASGFQTYVSTMCTATSGVVALGFV
jgi:hypothetical protein